MLTIAALMVAAVGQAATPSQSPPPAQPGPTIAVTVVGAAPLPGAELPVGRIPAPVQTATADDIEQSGAQNLADFLNRRLESVHVNDLQGNPLQTDLNYRGYTASPLLGTPQGVSVYFDGVRLNQPLGDVVSWDLIPRIAIANLALIPGSNPVFGLNTLGGALSIRTKDGLAHRATLARASYGSDARWTAEFDHGGRRDGSPVHWYLAGSFFGERGWRAASPSRTGQGFGKLGWQGGGNGVTVIGGYADTALTGNGLQDFQLLDRDYESVYTKPDETDNRSTLFSAESRHVLSSRTLLTFNGHYRYVGTSTLNGDLNEASLDQQVYQPTPVERAVLAAAGYTGVPSSGANAENTPFPYYRCVANVLLEDEPAELCNGLINRTRSQQHSGGVSAQLTRRDPVAGAGDLVTLAGGTFDRSLVGFEQGTELGYLNPDRSIMGTGAFADGETGGLLDGEPYDTRVDLDGDITQWSLYLSGALPLGDRWSVTASGRYNHSTITNADRIHPGGGPGSLDGDHAYGRFNPAAGVTFRAGGAVDLYSGYSESNRAPTAIELGCADPETPCRLPNAMAGDPPLEQVVARTWEAGGRGRIAPITWNVGYFHAVNRDDILFVVSEQTGFGYFRNVGETRRRGVEIGTDARKGRVSLGAGYTWLDATFRTEEAVNGTANSTNDAAASGSKGVEGTIVIEPGDRMPLVPRHVLKVYGGVDITRRLAVDVNLVAAGAAFARGNENNEHEPDGEYYLGAGRVNGYAVVSLGVQFSISPRIMATAQADNLFGREYATAAQLGAAGLTDDGAFIARPFPPEDGAFPIRHTTLLAPGAPRRGWFGMTVRF